MRRLMDLAKLDRLDRLIRMKSTGCPNELAKRLGISRSSLYEIMSFLRDEIKAPIRYNEYILSYEYTYPTKFYLGFERDRSKETETDNAFDGS